MTFLQFAEDWIDDNIQNRNARQFLTEICVLIDEWNLTSVELDLYKAHLFQLLIDWNRSKDYD